MRRGVNYATATRPTYVQHQAPIEQNSERTGRRRVNRESVSEEPLTLSTVANLLREVKAELLFAINSKNNEIRRQISAQDAKIKFIFEELQMKWQD